MSIVQIQAGCRIDRPMSAAGPHGSSTAVGKGLAPVAHVFWQVSRENPAVYDFGLLGSMAAVPGTMVPVARSAHFRVGRGLPFVDVVKGGGKQPKQGEAGNDLAKVLGIGRDRGWQKRQGECDDC